MVMQLDILAVLALALLPQASSLPDRRPTQTAFVDLTGNLLGFSPKPTGLVQRKDHGFFQRRQTAPGPTCGYISGNFYNPVTCDATQYCAANTNYGVFGCCGTYSPLPNGDYTFSQCEFRSRCYDYTASNDCTGTCASNTLNGYCTDSDYPLCQTFSLTDIGLSAFACNTRSDYTIVARLTATTTYSVSPQVDEPTQGATIGGVTTITVGPTPTDEGGSSTSQNNSAPGKTSVVGPAVGGAIGGLALILIAVGGAFWLRMKNKKNKRAAAAATGGNTGPGGAGTGAGAGAAVAGAATGAYAANEYYKTQDPTNGNHEPGPPIYSGQQMSQTYPPNQNLHPNSMSEMPNSPTITHSSVYGSQQPLSEIDGNNSTAPVSPVVGGAAHAQRKSVGTNSLMSGSGGDRTELDNTSTSGQPNQPSTQEGPAGAVPSAGASTQPRSQSGLGFQAGPVSDWNRPYHELE